MLANISPVPAGVRGQVGGTQQSLNALFQLLSFALGLVFPDPKEFHIYVSAGYCAVSLKQIVLIPFLELWKASQFYERLDLQFFCSQVVSTRGKTSYEQLMNACNSF